MAKQSRVFDAFSNMIVRSITLSAANVLTFEDLNIGFTILDRAALKIERLEYDVPSATFNLLTAGLDSLEFGLTTSNNLSDLDPAQQEVIDAERILRQDIGTPGNTVYQMFPLVKDLTNLSGGGLLVAPKPLYFAGNSESIASAATFKLRMFFTIVQLQQTEYIELLETRNAFS